MSIRDNIEFLIDISGVTQKDIADRSDMSESTFLYLKNADSNRKPRGATLKKLARTFSQITPIPYHEFENGQALLTKDFREIYERYKARSLQKNETSPDITNPSTASERTGGENEPPGQYSISVHEENLIFQLRMLINRDFRKPLTEPECVKLHTLVNGIRRMLHDAGQNSIFD